MRRFDREIKEISEIVKIIDECEVLRIGMVEQGKPYIVPMNFGYVYEDNQLIFYFHSASAGRKMEIMQENPQVCFEMDCGLMIHPGEIRCTTTTEYKSVMGEGEVIFVDDPSEKKVALDKIMEKYGFTGPFEFNEHVFRVVRVGKIIVTSFTAKKNPNHLNKGKQS